MPITPAGDFLYYRDLADGHSTSVAGGVCQLDLNASNFDFSRVRADGGDLAVYDLTAGAVVPSWVRDFKPSVPLARLFFKAANTSHAHRMYYGNPSMSPVVNFPAVYLHGTGFDADWGDLATATAGANAQLDRVPAATGWGDPRYRRIWRRSKTPTILGTVIGTVGGVTYIGTRDMAILTDRRGVIVPDGSGNWIGYVGAQPPTAVGRATFRCVSPDGGATWGGYTPVLMPDQPYDTGGAIPGSAIRISPGLYYMWYSATGGTLGGVGLATSTDGLTWVKHGVVVSATEPNIIDYVCGSNAVPRVRLMRDGKWTMYCESRATGGNWNVAGWTAPTQDGPWTVMNGGHVVLSGNAGIWWGTGGFANPYVDELDDGSGYVLFTNGHLPFVNPTDYNFQSGFLTAVTYNGPYTPDAKSPPFGKHLVAYGVETDVLAIDPATRERVVYIQDYVDRGGEPQPDIYRVFPIADRGGLMVSYATGDAAIAGRPLESGTFTAESVSWMTAHRSEDSAPYVLALVDVPALPTPAPSGSLPGIYRLAIRRTTFANASPGDVQFYYYDASDAGHSWDGSAWGTAAATAAASDPNRPVRARISDDGANFLLAAYHDDDGTPLASASVAKSSVKPFANPRFLLVGDLFTNAFAGATFFRQVGVRPYAATEPAITPGAPVALASRRRRLILARAS